MARLTAAYGFRWASTAFRLSRFRQLLNTPFNNYDHVGCVDFRFWRGATREHPPKWGCDRGATKPEPKSDATLRAAVLFGPDVVARSLQTPEGYARRSRLVWAKNPSPQTWSYLWNGVLSSPLKKPPGEGTGPTHADLRGNPVGRVPPRGEPDVFQQAVSLATQRPARRSVSPAAL